MAQLGTHLLVFGDQVIDKRPMIRNLVRSSKSSPGARRFLQEATDAVQIGIAKLTPDEHGWVGSFESLLALAEEHHSREASDTGLFFITSLLALIGRLGDLIVRAERDPTIIGSKERPIHVLALCAGQVPAAAAIAAQDTSELYTIAREIISEAFRWMRVTTRNRLAMISPNQKGGWCITYRGLEPSRAQAILDQFHASHNIPTIHKVAIGVVSRGWLTLVGPSSSLQRLVQFSEDLRQTPNIPADAGVPAHAPFMAGVATDDVVGHSALLDRPLDWEKAVMVSPSGDCPLRKFGTLRELLCDVFEDILLRTLPVEKTIESCVSKIDRNVAVVNVHEVGTTSHMPMVLRTLGAAGLPYDVVPAYQATPLQRNAIQSRGNSDLVAIVGMSGRFPGSDNVDELWKELIGGACHIKKIPKNRFDVDRYYDANQKLKNSTAVKDGAFLNNPGHFDNRFFNVSPREAAQMDPAQRICLMATHEALEMAGYAPGASPAMTPERVATFIGNAGNDWQSSLQQQGSDIYYVTGAAKAFLSGKINYHYKFGRGSYTLETVCSSSTAAVTLACKGLISRDCDMAVAGGASVLSAPYDYSGLGRSGMLSLDGGCRTFHDDADGYARGEAVGIVILKRLEDALMDKDNILGVISGSARTYSTTSTSITHPSHVSQEKTYREVLGQTALDPQEIAYVELHGTGTQAGDLEEVTSVLNVMGEQRLANNQLTMGAVKASMGHGEGAAGITALIKMLMMLKHRKIPAQPGWPFKLNHRLPNLDKRNVNIALENKPLRASPKAADGKIKMMVNTFDASGGNCSLVVQEAPDSEYASSDALSRDVRSTHVVALSARSALSLQKNCENLVDYLKANPDTRLADLAYTTTARRMHSTLRKAFVCTSIEDLVLQIRQRSTESVKKAEAPPVVFVFTGQGSQYASMGRNLYQTSQRFRDMMNTYQLTASHLGLPQFLSIISGDMDISTATPAQVQLAIVALELGKAYMLKSWGIVPDAVIGHSLGEYAALCVSGVLSPSDALYLVGHRALLMEKHLMPDTHAMLAVSMSQAKLSARIEKEQQVGRLLSCTVSCINSPEATVAGGSSSDMAALRDILTGEETRSTLLRVPFGFHSAQVEPVLGEFTDIADGIVFKKPLIPVASTLTGQLVDSEGVFGPSYLARQAREPVNFVGALEAVDEFGSKYKNPPLWIEIGPTAVCLGMVRKTLHASDSCLLPALTPTKDSWETASGMLKTAYENRLPVDWKAYHSEFADSLALLSDLPSYAWDNNNYWTTYTEPPAWEIQEALDAINGHEVASKDQARATVANGFIPTMTLQVLVDETVDKSSGAVTAVFSSNAAAAGLDKAINGHIVNGHPVMPLAVFCDMAMTSARHCYSRVAQGPAIQGNQMTLRNMVISRAVVLKSSSPSPVVLTTANYSSATEAVNITFHQATEKGELGPLVGECSVMVSTAIPPKPLSSEQSQTMFLIKTRMEQLRGLAATGKAHCLLRPIVYRLFGDYVRCGKEYQSMDEVIVSDGSQDALASLTAPVSVEAAANCAASPFLQDGVNQLTGFLLNNSIRSGDDQVIFISEGFGESRQWEPLVSGKKYTTYASGHDIDASGTIVDAASYVFDAESGRLVQMTTGVRFRKMNKTVFNHVLGETKSKVAGDSRSPASSTDTPSRGDLSTSVNRTSQAVKSDHFVTPHATIEPTVKATSAILEPVSAQPESSLIASLVAIVAAEVGVAPDDVTDETLFEDLGVDSLMAVTVLSKIRDELDLDLPAAFFMDYDSVGAAKQALGMQMQDVELVESSSFPSGSDTDGYESAMQLTPGSPEISIISDNQEEINSAWESIEVLADVKLDVQSSAKEKLAPAVTVVEIEEQVEPNCRIIHFQGSQQGKSPKASPTVFLLADETGSSVGYVHLPSLGGLCVYGVDWPANLHADQQPDLLSFLADSIVASIDAHSAPAPYILAGVSFGAVLAVEVARRMTASSCAGMLLLDPPADAQAVVRTRARLAKTRMLRPAQGRNIDAAADALQDYNFEAWNAGSLSPAVLVLPEDKSDARDKLSGWLPGAKVEEVKGVQSGTLLKLPNVNAIGSVCQGIVNGMQ